MTSLLCTRRKIKLNRGQQSHTLLLKLFLGFKYCALIWRRFSFIPFSLKRLFFQGAPSRSKNRVRFNDGQNADDNDDVDDFEDDRNGQMSFSPPR